MKRCIWIVVTFVVGITSTLGAGIWYYKNTESLRFVQGLGAGINLGNSLDVYDIKKWLPNATLQEYEEAWGNPAISRSQLEEIADAGFTTVRIPVSWGEHLNEEGTIDPLWIARVESVVADALEIGLYVILNTHHELWLSTSSDSAIQVEEQLRSIWTQIATHFRNYDDHLLFEGMNEPRMRGSSEEWKSGTASERKVVNILNAAFVDTVRRMGGKNSQRYLLIGGYASNRYENTLVDLTIPKGDSRIIVSVHAYVPYSFAQDINGDDSWDDSKRSQVEDMEQMFLLLDDLFISKKIPVVISEYGALDKDNLPARITWANYYTKTASSYGIPCIWWDDGGQYRLLNRENGGWHFPQLVALLVENTPNK